MKLSIKGVVLKDDGTVKPNLEEDITLPRIPNGQREFKVINNSTGYDTITTGGSGMPSYQQQQLSNLKSKFNNLTNDPLMNLTFTGSDPNNVLQSQLNSEKNTSQTNIAQNKNLSEQLSQLKNTLDGSIKNLKQLQDEVENQNKIKQNIDYYLVDYGNSSDSTKEIDELIGALIENNNE